MVPSSFSHDDGIASLARAFRRDRPNDAQVHAAFMSMANDEQEWRAFVQSDCEMAWRTEAHV